MLSFRAKLAERTRNPVRSGSNIGFYSGHIQTLARAEALIGFVSHPRVERPVGFVSRRGIEMSVRFVWEERPRPSWLRFGNGGPEGRAGKGEPELASFGRKGWQALISERRRGQDDWVRLVTSADAGLLDKDHLSQTVFPPWFRGRRVGTVIRDNRGRRGVARSRLAPRGCTRSRARGGRRLPLRRDRGGGGG